MNIINDTMDENSNSNPTFIFIDGSYYCFHRYFALMQWWKNAHPTEPLDNPYENTAFVEKFKKTFVENIQQMSKKLKIHKVSPAPIIVVGKDCKREDIWRNDIFPDYKANRANGAEDGFMGGPFFAMAYGDELFHKGGAKAILSHPKLEADDCIALSVKHLLDKYPFCNIYIITSDRDYLQLNAPNVHLYNLAYKNIAENKSSTGHPKKDLLIKTIMGDTSDNIPACFPKCGIKTALKCVEDPLFFVKKMAEKEAYYKQYELNNTLVNFDYIPEHLVAEFMASIGVNTTTKC